MCLDALGDDAQVEPVGEVDGRADDRGVLRAVGHARDERLVDLELVDAELFEVGERGVTGAEVIKRDRDANLAEWRPSCTTRVRASCACGLDSVTPTAVTP